MSNVSRGKRNKQERLWAAERSAKWAKKEAERQAKLAALKAAVLAPLGPKKAEEEL